MENYEEEQWGTTDMKIVNFKYVWTLNNYSFNRKETGQRITSPPFYMPGRQDFEWDLVLFPKGHGDETKDYISLYLRLVKATANPNIKTKAKLSILDRKNEEKYTNNIDYVFEKVSGYGSSQFIKQITLSNLKDELLPDDKLTIVCRVTAGLDIVENSSKDIIKFEGKRNEFRLSSELESLLQNEYMADVTLIADGKELKAHKNILAARSPVFLAMLQTDMQEKQTSRIDFADVSVDVLNEMLHYLYTGTAKRIKEYANDLLKLADKYDIKELKLMCEKVFHHELCVDNAIKLFILADRHNCNVLRPLILKFMVTNAKDIMKTVDFKKFEKDLPILIKEMMQAII